MNEPWISPTNELIRELITEAFKARGPEVPHERVSGSSILMRNHLLATGRFLTVLPDSVLRYNAKQWSLKALPVDLGVKARSVAIVTLKNRTLSPVARTARYAFTVFVLMTIYIINNALTRTEIAATARNGSSWASGT